MMKARLTLADLVAPACEGPAVQGQGKGAQLAATAALGEARSGELRVGEQRGLQAVNDEAAGVLGRLKQDMESVSLLIRTVGEEWMKRIAAHLQTGSHRKGDHLLRDLRAWGGQLGAQGRSVGRRAL